jgi:hypothetical protein
VVVGDLCVIGESDCARPGHRSRPASWLARHGIDAALSAASPGLEGGAPLPSLAAYLGADLLVMGGYGRARLGELPAGGAPGSKQSCTRLSSSRRKFHSNNRRDLIWIMAIE